MIGCLLQVVISDCATQGDASDAGTGGTSTHLHQQKKNRFSLNQSVRISSEQVQFRSVQF